MKKSIGTFAVGCWLVWSSQASAQQPTNNVRFYEENGITYRETKEIVRRPVTETRLEDRQRTVYRPQPVAGQTQQCYRTVRVPVTEYRTVNRWVGRYNPFVQPQLVQDQIPVTRWEYRTEVVNVPVAGGTRMVAETVTDKVPVQSRRFVEEEVTRRVAVSGGPATSNLAYRSAPSNNGTSAAIPSSDPFARSQPVVSTPMATQPPIGGVAKMESDPPRQGVNSGWRQAIPVRR